MSIRRAIRFPGDKSPVSLRCPNGDSVDGVVEDESITGLGVRCAVVPDLAPGTEVAVTFLKFQYRAVVRHVRPSPAGGGIVGIEWSDKERATDVA